MKNRSDDFQLWEKDMAEHDYSGDHELAAVATSRATRIRLIVAQLVLLAVLLAIAFTAGYSIGWAV